MRRRFGVRAVAAFGLLSFLAGGVVWAQEAEPFIGSWKGSLTMMGTVLEIALHFKLGDDRKIEGTFDSITQGGYGIKLGKIELAGTGISFILDDPNAKGEPAFRGTLDESGKKLAGEFTQFGYEGTFAVERQPAD